MAEPAKKLIVANWKMYGSHAMMAAYAEGLKAALASAPGGGAKDVVLCPPFPYLERLAGLMAHFPRSSAQPAPGIGAQDCAAEEADGAATGEVSVRMLKECGCGHVIVGHSERRRNQQETDSMVAGKASAALNGGLMPIICIGETDQQAQANLTEAVLTAQMAALAPLAAKGQAIVIAYEPIWAIGTGKVATLEEIAGRHKLIRQLMEEHRLDGRVLYGGSVKPANARAILAAPNVDGVLVGGASLDPGEFAGIIQSAPA